MKTIIFFTTVLLTALSAGFFLAWSVSVILGIKKVGDFTYLELMQNINREILNPVFFIVFFGSLILLIVNACLQFNNKAIFLWVLASAAIYLIGTFGITVLGNVPLNNELDSLNISKLNTSELKKFRTHYENHWNQYHSIRTIAAMISFALLLIALFFQKNF